MLDLTQERVSETGVLHLKNAHGELMFYAGAADKKLPVTVTIYGPGSAEYERAQLAARKRAAHLIKAHGAKGAVNRSPDERREEAAKLLADITVCFIGVDYQGLAGRELALAIYKDQKLGFIVDQVNDFAADWANFTTAAQAA